MGRKRKIPKKLVVPTEPMVEEPLKIYHTPEAFYLDHLRSLCARAETPTSLVEGKSLDEHACYVRHRISEKGKLLWSQIQRLQCYAWNLCEIYDFTCCSENPKKHLPYQCEFSDMELYLHMLRAFIITMMFNKLKNLLLLRVLMKLLL